ncbi:DUF1294 domain-containing protein [Caproiciproducens sp. LBM24188]
MPDYIYFIGWLIIINFIAMAATISDKRRAARHRWRIPENDLLLLSALGGSPAMLITMKKIRHKTQRKKFMIGIPLILFFQIVLCGSFLYFKYYA